MRKLLTFSVLTVLAASCAGCSMNQCGGGGGCCSSMCQPHNWFRSRPSYASAQCCDPCQQSGAVMGSPMMMNTQMMSAPTMSAPMMGAPMTGTESGCCQ